MEEDLVDGPGVGEWRPSVSDEADPGLVDEGLRERKKRLTRSMISGTATMMFVQRGFDNVKITESPPLAASRRKRSTTTSPPKNPWSSTAKTRSPRALNARSGPGPNELHPSKRPSHDREQVRQLVAYVRGANMSDMSPIRAFTEMVNDTPSLRAAQFDMTERLAQVVARAMATRAGVDPEDPSPKSRPTPCSGSGASTIAPP